MGLAGGAVAGFAALAGAGGIALAGSGPAELVEVAADAGLVECARCKKLLVNSGGQLQ